MGLKPFFTYFGGKWRIAPKYPAPRHDILIEPFAGSAGYSLRHPEKSVVLVDLFPPIVETWKYLIGASAEEILALPDLEDGQSVDDLDLPIGARYFIGWWLNAGASSPCKTPGAWMRQYRDGSQLFWGPRVRARVAGQVAAIRHWIVMQGAYGEIDDVLATWFVDPPYQRAGKDYIHSSKALDFADLGVWCRSRSGQVIVCENEGADWLPFEPFVLAKGTAGARRTGKSAEVIYTQ